MLIKVLRPIQSDDADGEAASIRDGGRWCLGGSLAGELLKVIQTVLLLTQQLLLALTLQIAVARRREIGSCMNTRHQEQAGAKCPT
ncbi:hypothetical protein D3C76_1757230 [compost metagenome]